MKAYSLNQNLLMRPKAVCAHYAWYVGGGIQRNDIKFKPSLYYRYAFMQGDDPTTSTYERYDPLLSSGLGNWVQGINFRKVVGNGNLLPIALN
jgi:hypothetical protein